MHFLQVSSYKANPTKSKAQGIWDYTTFGSPMPTRTWSDPNSKYKYGFNGKEKDNETNADGGSYDFGARIYDSRLGRWLSLDPLMMKYPHSTPFNFCINNPIYITDVDGRDIIYNKNLKDKTFYTGAIQIARYSSIVTNLMNKFASSNSGNITNSSSGVLSRHTLEFKKIGGGMTGGETGIKVKIDGEFVEYKSGMKLPPNAEFKIVVGLSNIYSQNGSFEQGILAGSVSHELLVHAEMATAIIEQYENDLLAAGNDKDKIAEAEKKLSNGLDNWEKENKGGKKTEAHKKMAKGDTKLDEALDEVVKVIDDKLKAETDVDKKTSLEEVKNGVLDSKNFDIPPK